VTHPYGTFTFATDGAGTTINGGNAIRFEDPAGTAANYLPPLMKSAAITNMGPFLKRATGGLILDPVSGHTYIGDGVTPTLVTGSPTGNNFFRVERLNAAGGVAATWQTNAFVLMGRVFTGQIPSPTTIDRVTYARDAAGATQIDAFATALPTAFLSIAGATGLASTGLTQDVPNTGKFFAHIPTAGLPTGVNITNSLDVPPILYPVTMRDEVVISQAFYTPVTRNLTIKADSRDNLAPLPSLTVTVFGAPHTLDATGTVIIPLPLNTIPPANITVVSSRGGSATAQVSVDTPPPVVPPAPLAITTTSSLLTPYTLGTGAYVAPTLTATGGTAPYKKIKKEEIEKNDDK
jgi:hypothetical protein